MRSSQIWLPLSVTAVGLMITIGFSNRSRAASQREIKATFALQSQDVLARISRRLQSYERSLLATRGHYQASDLVSRKAFASFVTALDLEPGMRAIGYAALVPAREKERHLAQVRRDGFPDYRIRPEGNREVYCPVLFLEPFLDRNAKALGFDMLSEPVRHEAAMRARDENRISMSGKVQLVQDAAVHPGFLLYVPVFRNGKATETLEDRRANQAGYLYTAFRMDDLMQGILAGTDDQQVDVELFDGPVQSAPLLYDRDAKLRSLRGSSTLQATQTLTFGGHSWTMVTHALPGLLAGHRDTSQVELALGSLVSLLLGLLAFTSVRQVHNIRLINETLEQRVELRTKELVENESKLKMLLDSTAEAIYGIDTRGECTFCNPACLKMTGYTDASQLLGKNMHALIHHSHEDGDAYPVQECQIFLAYSQGHGTHVDDEVFWRADGTSFPVEYWSYPQRQDGQVLGAVVTFIDITERKQAEEEKAKLMAQLQQSQKMESLGTLAGGVAHDMNNVLGAILGLASTHIDSQPIGSPLHKALDTICKATERGGKMVKSLLSFARQSPAENNKIDMNAILSEQVALLERTTLSKVRLEINLDPDLRPILGDASALTHAFMNLCVNAVDAMPANGTLSLRTRNVDSNWIEVVVEDNGRGMPKEVLGRAMEPFFTTKETGKGTGLGLSMVFSTVSAHRGQMDIQSELGQGTRIVLRFPAYEQAAQIAAPAASEAMLPPQGSLKVLLVDDDELIQSSLQALLERLGHTVVTAAQSGEEALVMLEAGLDPGLVILDMNMPGLGGVGTLPRLRALRPKLPVLLATGRIDQTALTLASAHPGVTLLSKPFGLRELQKHIENIGQG